MRAPRWRWAGVALVVVLAGVFSWLNAEEAVALHFGFFDLYQVSVVTVAYLAFLLGMATMFLLGLGHDLRVRRLLRERGLLEDLLEDPHPGPAHRSPEQARPAHPAEPYAESVPATRQPEPLPPDPPPPDLTM